MKRMLDFALGVMVGFGLSLLMTPTNIRHAVGLGLLMAAVGIIYRAFTVNDYE